MAGWWSSWPIRKKPAQGVGKNRQGVFAVVTAIAPRVVHFVAGEGERTFHFLIRLPPITAVNVLIRGAVLQKNANGLRLKFTDERGVNISPA